MLDPYRHARYSPAVQQGRLGFRVRTSGAERFYAAEWALGASRGGTRSCAVILKGSSRKGGSATTPSPASEALLLGSPARRPWPIRLVVGGGGGVSSLSQHHGGGLGNGVGGGRLPVGNQL